MDQSFRRQYTSSPAPLGYHLARKYTPCNFTFEPFDEKQPRSQANKPLFHYITATNNMSHRSPSPTFSTGDPPSPDHYEPSLSLPDIPMAPKPACIPPALPSSTIAVEIVCIGVIDALIDCSRRYEYTIDELKHWRDIFQVCIARGEGREVLLYAVQQISGLKAHLEALGAITLARDEEEGSGDESEGSEDGKGVRGFKTGGPIREVAWEVSVE